MKSLILVAAGWIAAGAAPAVAAQTPPPPAAPVAPAIPPVASEPGGTLFPGLSGPPVAGVCLISREDLITRSKVGLAATTHLKEIATQLQANLEAEKTKLEARGKALAEKRASFTPEKRAGMTPEQLQAAGKALQAEEVSLQRRDQGLQTEAAERSRAFDATKVKALGAVFEAARPFVADAFAAHKCGLLIARETALGGNFSADLTPEVLTAFDAKGAPVAGDPAQPSH